MSEKYIEYKGLLFCRDDKTGYYLNGTIHKRLHQYVWEMEAGEIPPGFHVHHIDRDVSNNCIDNLCLLTQTGHEKLHSMLGADEETKQKRIKNFEEKVRPAAIQWHKSEEGRKWHSQKSLKMYENMKSEDFVCAYCGKTFSALPVGVHLYCSNACRSAARRKRGDDNEKRVCEICGEEFLANKYSKTRFCSRRCMGINRTMINEQKRKDGIQLRSKNKKSKGES